MSHRRVANTILNDPNQNFIKQDHRDPIEKAKAGGFGPLSTLMKQFDLSIVKPLDQN